MNIYTIRELIPTIVLDGQWLTEITSTIEMGDNYR